MFKVLVDGDACPVKDELAALCEVFHFDWWLFVDDSHWIDEPLAHVVYCDTSKDSVDLALLRVVQAKDLVLTNDRGLAAWALTKGAYVMDFDGQQIDEKNIDAYLWLRYERQKGRLTSRPRARKMRQNQQFYQACRTFLEGRT